jgi:hypothetical protein
MAVVPDPAYSALGLKPPERRFTVRLTPGAVSTGQISYLELTAKDLWQISVTRPVNIVVALPAGAELAEVANRGVVVPDGSINVCASGSPVVRLTLGRA